ncbi:GTP-binding protein [Luteimicrobium sp. DT211]|uniref:GTP-binding protein n=1 Tax=Luteimicrobium sp. DT211 TaxID=3393412 RepID=UPI003CEB4C7F
MRTVTIGVLAHVDAGKTTLTERLLLHAGAIDHAGSVDSGDTQTDTLELERRRGITIRSAVAALRLDDLTVNLVDTPGHADFVAEVARAVTVLDGAVLLLSAVEGVQARTRVLLRTLRRLGVPTVLFANKVDRAGARTEALADEIRARLTPRVVPVSTVTAAGTHEARVAPRDPAGVSEDLATALLDEPSSAPLVDAYLAGRGPLVEAPDDVLADGVRAGTLHPLLLGSAATGAGVPALVGAVGRWFATTDPDGDAAAGPARGTVFAVDRGPGGERVAVVRLRSGTLRARDRVRLVSAGDSAGRPALATAVRIFVDGTRTREGVLRPGGIARVTGLDGVRVGDGLGDGALVGRRDLFALPTLSATVTPVRPAQRLALRDALQDLAARDPLVGVRLDDATGELAVSLYGEVQKEVLAATLDGEHGIPVAFSDSRALHVERPRRAGAAQQVMGTHPFGLVTVGLRVEPAAPGSGVAYVVGAERGLLLRGFHVAVEETVRALLRQGPDGWPVTDVRVTLTHGRYGTGATAGAFRDLATVVLADALREAGTRVCEPVARFELETPADAVPAVVAALAAGGGTLAGRLPEGSGHDDAVVVTGRVRAAAVSALERTLPALTRGEGVLVTEPAGFEPVRGTPPRRARQEPDLLARAAQLRRLW